MDTRFLEIILLFVYLFILLFVCLFIYLFWIGCMSRFWSLADTAMYIVYEMMDGQKTSGCY